MWKAWTAAALALTLAGCASMNQLTSEVSSFSQWPTERKPGSYAFERLPSQQSRPTQQQVLEEAARHALAGAGFRPTADTGSAEFKVQLSARAALIESSTFEDPFWWHYELVPGRPHHGPYWRRSPAYRFDTSRYDREVALLIRDRKSGQVLYETRASNEGNTPAVGALLPAMFDAALKDFPHGGLNPRSVTIPLAPSP